MNRRHAAYVILASLVLMCGCETIGAFGTGRMKSSDVSYIARSGTLIKKAAPVNVNDPYSDEEYENLPDAGPRHKARVSNVDEWLEENLW